ncbi:hypothetical protein P3G55_18995 [Leptospira sp. 96542]|nr:hypothetical protein [Leptospira sp. 96542]
MKTFASNSIYKCEVPYCHDYRHGLSNYCRNHAAHKRRHGAAVQVPVTAHELNLYTAMVEAKYKRNKNSSAWVIMQERWGAIRDEARAAVLQFQLDPKLQKWVARSRESNLHQSYHAYAKLEAVAETVEPWKVIKTGLAMFLLQERSPRRFVSDVAFDTQLARRILRLAPVHSLIYWDSDAGRSKQVYRDVAPRTMQYIAGHLKRAFGQPGLLLAQTLRKEAERPQQQAKRLSEEIAAMV